MHRSELSGSTFAKNKASEALVHAVSTPKIIINIPNDAQNSSCFEDIFSITKLHRRRCHIFFLQTLLLLYVLCYQHRH